MSQQKNQKDKVEVRQCTVKQSRYGPTECSQELRNIVEVSRHSPPTRSKKKTFLFLSFGCQIGRVDELRSTAPDFTVALCVTNVFFLSIGVVVYEDSQDSDGEDGQG